MGKRLIAQRRGRKQSPTYRSPSHRYLTKTSYPKTDGKMKVTVKDLVVDPARTSPLMVLQNNKHKVYFLPAPINITVGDQLVIGAQKTAKPGNVMLLRDVPVGHAISNIELKPNDGGKICKSSGSFARVLEKTTKKVTVRLPSKKKKELDPNCRATIGIIAGSGRPEKPFVKAGKKHYAMKAKNKLYPKVSAVSMNAVDHPFGSGRGSHMGKPSTSPKFAPPGRKAGHIRSKKTGRGGKK